MNHLATGMYAVLVIVTDPKSKIKNTDLIFSVTVKCTKKIDLVSGAIANFDYQISLTAPYTMSVPLPQY